MSPSSVGERSSTAPARPAGAADVAFADGVIIGVGGDLAAAHPDATIVDADG